MVAIERIKAPVTFEHPQGNGGWSHETGRWIHFCHDCGKCNGPVGGKRCASCYEEARKLAFSDGIECREKRHLENRFIAKYKVAYRIRHPLNLQNWERWQEFIRSDAKNPLEILMDKEDNRTD